MSHYKVSYKTLHYSSMGGFVRLALVLLAALVLMGCGGPAQPRVYRVGILSGLDFFADTATGFKEQMTALGYVEGKNIVYQESKTNFDMAMYRSTLDKFVQDKVDLIFVFPTEASLEAKVATAGTNIPVVFANAAIEGVGLVNSVREPGGNVTGVRYPGPDLSVKRLEVLLAIAPQAKRVWVTYLKDYPIVAPELEVLRPAAASLGVELIEAPATSVADIQQELEARAKSADSGVDAILIIPEPLTVTPDSFEVMAKFAAQQHVPVGGALVSSGGYDSIFGVSTDNVAVGKQAALTADKILKGVKPSEIPVASAENYLQINYKAAQQLGLTVPEGLLAQAEQVIR